MAYPSGTPVAMLAGQVRNPVSEQNGDGNVSPMLLGRHGEQLISHLHGRRYSKAARSNLFWGSSGVAGASLLAPGGTTGSFVLFNPPTSGVLLEVEKLLLSGASTETCVISGIAMEGTVQTPTGTLTGTTTTGMPLGNSRATALGKVYKACTISAMTFIGGVGRTIIATSSPGNPMEVDFDGTLVLAPGFALNFVSAITQSANIVLADILWSEWLA